MAWSRKQGKSGSDAWTMEESARKRRRVEKEERKQPGPADNDDWDDSLELTQAELETLDTIASQAIVEDAPAHEHEAANGAAAAADDTLFFTKPALTPHSFARRSTSSSSNSSAHPASLSSSRSASDASGSLSSHTSENGKADTEVDIVLALRAQLEQEKIRAQEEKYRSAGEMTFLRESLYKQEEELEKVRAERDAGLEKEKIAKKENERALQTKLNSMMSQAQFKDCEFKNLQEQYQALQHKLRKFEQEKQQSSSESEALASPSSKTGSPRKVSVRPSPPSKQRLKQIEEGGPKWKGFMEQAPTGPSTSTMKTSMSSAACQTAGAKQSRRLKLRVPSQNDSATGVTGTQVVKHLLGPPPLCQSPVVPQYQEDWDPGLMGLMHAMSTTLRVARLTYSRSGGRGSNSLTPLKPKGNATKKLSKDDSSGTLQVVTREHFQLAVDGLQQLLEHGKNENLPSESGGMLTYLRECLTRSDSKEKSLTSKRSGDNQASTSSRLSTMASKPGQDNEISAYTSMILPLLTDYIQHYVDLLSSPHAKAANIAGLARSQHPSVSPYRSTLESTTHSTTSSSLESSLDSLNSSVLQLLHDGHVYAAGIEGYTSTALRCITLLLLLCPALVGYILTPTQQFRTSTNTFASSTSGNSSAVEADPRSETEADDEKSTSSSEVRIVGTTYDHSLTPSKPSVQSPVLYHLMLQLAGQDLNDSSCASGVVAQALHVLTLLCQGCQEEQISKLESICTRGVLTNCLRHVSHVPVLVWAVRLQQALGSRTALFSKLCAKSENCPLFLMHRINSNKDSRTKCDDMVIFYKEYISCLSSMISEQPQGLQQLLSNSCPCANELVTGVVLALFWLFKTYQKKSRRFSTKTRQASNTAYSHTRSPSNPEEESASLLWTLGKGITLLHAVAQADTAFLQHQARVQPQYVSLLSGLRAVLKAKPAGWEFHLFAVEELCDFEPDLSDLSQESESEDRMDQT